jgi:hypothetical protein
MSDPTIEQIYAALMENGYGGDELTIDRSIAIHYFAEAWYDGQFSNLYRVMCSIRYDSRGLVLDSESDMVQEMYRFLERHFYPHHHN